MRCNCKLAGQLQASAGTLLIRLGPSQVEAPGHAAAQQLGQLTAVEPRATQCVQERAVYTNDIFKKKKKNDNKLSIPRTLWSGANLVQI